MKLFTKLMISALAGIAAFAPAGAQQNPEMLVVVFRADWCNPCKILEPNLSNALNILRDPSINVVVIDQTNPTTIENSAMTAFNHNIVAQYNSWFGITGFAAIIDADTKRTLGCVTIDYNASTMATHIKNLKTYAVTNQASFDLTCPAPNPPR